MVAAGELSFQEMEIPIYNSRIYLAGKHEWQAVTVNFRDDAGGNVSRLVGEQLQKQMDFVEMASAASGIDYKFLTRCEVLDGGNGASTPTVLETWELYGCYVSSVDYGNLDYSASEPATIQMSLRFDNAVQTPLGDGVGATVGRTVGDVVTG